MYTTKITTTNKMGNTNSYSSSAQDNCLHHYYTRVNHHLRRRHTSQIIIRFGRVNHQKVFFVFEDNKKNAIVVNKNHIKGLKTTKDAVLLKQTNQMKQRVMELLNKIPQECRIYLVMFDTVNGFVEQSIDEITHCEMYPFLVFKLNTRLKLEIDVGWSIFPQKQYH